MLNQKGITWLLTLIGFFAAGVLIDLLLRLIGLPLIGNIVGAVFHFAAVIWVLIGVTQWSDRRWVQQAGFVFVSGLIATLLATIAYYAGAYQMAMAWIGVWMMTAVFVGGLALIRLILRPGLPMFGVARTLIDEAVRMKVVLVLVVVLMLVVPILPMALGANERLSYRVSFALTWSIIIVSVLLSLLTIFLTCWTISGEIERKQIFTTLTKPISRFQYMFGKWLGVCLFNLLLVMVSGIGIGAYARVLAATPISVQGKAELAEAQLDHDRIDQEILVSRDSVRPTPPTWESITQAYQHRLAQLRETDPQTYADPIDPRLHKMILDPIVERFYVCPPNPNPDRPQGRLFSFQGLQNAHDYGDQVVLRLKPRAARAPGDEMVNLFLLINQGGRPLRIAHNAFYRVEVPVEAISPKGELEIRLVNLQPDTTVRFAPGDGIEVLYPVGSFEANLLKSLLVIWVRLCFLGALGLSAGAFLSFPIACMVACVVYFAAANGDFIQSSLRDYASYGYADDADAIDKVSIFFSGLWGALVSGDKETVFKGVIKIVADTFLLIIPSLSEYNPAPLVSDGRNVPLAMLVGDWGPVSAAFGRGEVGSTIAALMQCFKQGALQRVALWSALVGGIGYMIFRRRELARVIV